MDELLDFRGKVALVTGGSRGLGREMTLALARRGAAVVIASRKMPACEAVAEEARALGVEALPYACHVGHWGELEGLADAAWERFGKVDILINNAGMSPLYPSLGAISEELFDKVMNVNFKGPFRLSALIGERMAAGQGGSIINVSSTASPQPQPGFGALRRRQGRVERHHALLRLRLRTEGAGELHRCRPLPHRHLQGLGHAGLREAGQGQSRLASGVGGRRRSSALRSTSPATSPASPPAP